MTAKNIDPSLSNKKDRENPSTHRLVLVALYNTHWTHPVRFNVVFNMTKIVTQGGKTGTRIYRLVLVACCNDNNIEKAAKRGKPGVLI